MAITYNLTKDSVGSFLVQELEKLDNTLNKPLMSFTWSRDITLREDVTIADDTSSFTRSDFSANGGLSATGKSWAGKNTTALGNVGVDIRKIANPLTLWARNVDFSIPELEASIQVGRPVDVQKVEALNYKFQADIDAQVYIGDTDLGIQGMFNSDTLVIPVNVANGAGGTPQWATKTPLEIVKDIQDAERAAWEATGFSLVPTELRIPATHMKYLQQPLTVGGTSFNSILVYLKQNSLSMIHEGVELNIQAVKWLATAGVGSTARMVLYRNENDKVRLPLVPLQRAAIQYQGLYILQPYYGKVGAVEMVYPEVFAYRDLI